MARKLERPAPAAVSSGWNASTTIIFVALFIASLNGYFAYHRISGNATALNAEVLRTRQLLALLNKHRTIVAPPPMPTIVSADRKTSISKGVTVMPAKPQLIHSGGSPADPILGGQVKKGVVAKKTPAPTLKPDLIGNRGRPIDDDLIDRIKDEIKRSDAERERQGRPWLKTRPNKENEAGPTPRLRIAIASLNARGVQKQGGPQGGHGGGGALNKRPDWQHRHAAHNKLEYCKKWGYDLIIEDNSIVDTSRDVAWSKIPLLRKWLPQYDYIMWMDMDAFFMRFDIPLEAFIRDETKDVVMAKDWHGINLGVFLIKNSDFSFQLLNDMWNVPRHMWEPWQEQSALMKLLDVQFSGSQAKARDAAFFYIEQRDMNAYPQHFAYGNAKAMYLDGDPIAHFPNCKAFPQCKSLIERFYTVSCKVNGLDVLGNDPIIPMRIVPILPEMKVYQGKKLRPTTPPPLAKADQGEDENPPTLKPTAAPPTKAKADDESAEESEVPPTPKPTKKPSPKKSKKPRTPAPPEDDNDEKE